MSLEIALLLLGMGAVIGFLAGLLGIGGGMLMVPFVTLVLSSTGFPPEHTVRVAIATSLTTILFTSISSVRAHHRRGAVLWPVVRSLAPGIVVGSLFNFTISTVFRVALYRYATEGKVIGGFSEESMADAFAPRRGRRGHAAA